MISNLSRWLLRQPVRRRLNTPLRLLLSTASAASPPAETSVDPHKIVLRDYQEECIESVLTAVDEGHKRLGVSLATGGGKTIIFTHLIGRLQAASKDADQTLILAHRQELVEQAARHCTSTYPEKTIEIEMGKLHASGYADITVASVPSITSKDRLEKFDPGRFKLILVDEAHHIIAKTYLKTLEHFNLHRKHHASPTLVGVSATFSRSDGLALGKAIDHIVYHRDFMDMIKDKRLSDLMFTTVQSSADISGVRTAGKFADFVTSELSEAVNTPQVNAITVATWQAKGQPTRQSTLIFCVDVQHILDLCQAFCDRGIDARYVTGQTKAIKRSQILTDFKNKEFPVLLNCGVFTEGTDIPNIDCIVMARPTRSRNLLIQMIGRGMRLHPDKENCHVIDMVSTLETGIVTTPTLFGLDPDEILEEANIQDVERIKKELLHGTGSKNRKTQFSPTSGIELTDYDSVIDLLEDATDDKHIRALSRNSWVGIGENRYWLGGPTGSYLRLEKVHATLAELSHKFRKSSQTHTISNTAAYDMNMLSPPSNDDYFDDYDTNFEEVPDFGKPSQKPATVHYTLWYVAALQRNRAGKLGYGTSPYVQPRLMLIHTDFAAAVRASDMYAGKVFPHVFTNSRAKWRTGAPTPGQLMMVNKMRPKDKQLTEDDITKGQASDMITRMKFGAVKSRFAKISKVKEIAQKMVDRAKEHHEKSMKNAEVKVGPVRA
ncbi:hypothetical protein MKZ38_009706 [Zalerion maritima]|uniref:Uncharacterized protein n=1 Tax=Zalerion maritima TaxID=339359 RepID=A0AAD5WNG8_9PEZI|nr:hypothetical protein MKZ38_009706 [Zalerion maritima]